jgi:hypothetical protein
MKRLTQAPNLALASLWCDMLAKARCTLTSKPA